MNVIDFCSRRRKHEDANELVLCPKWLLPLVFDNAKNISEYYLPRKELLELHERALRGYVNNSNFDGAA